MLTIFRTPQAPRAELDTPASHPPPSGTSAQGTPHVKPQGAGASDRFSLKPLPRSGDPPHVQLLAAGGGLAVTGVFSLGLSTVRRVLLLLRGRPGREGEHTSVVDPATAPPSPHPRPIMAAFTNFLWTAAKNIASTTGILAPQAASPSGSSSSSSYSSSSSNGDTGSQDSSLASPAFSASSTDSEHGSIGSPKPPSNLDVSMRDGKLAPPSPSTPPLGSQAQQQRKPWLQQQESSEGESRSSRWGGQQQQQQHKEGDGEEGKKQQVQRLDMKEKLEEQQQQENGQKNGQEQQQSQKRGQEKGKKDGNPAVLRRGSSGERMA